jgi:hypothetical protein
MCSFIGLTAHFTMFPTYYKERSAPDLCQFRKLVTLVNHRFQPDEQLLIPERLDFIANRVGYSLNSLILSLLIHSKLYFQFPIISAGLSLNRLDRPKRSR